jgi:hypothetical protein
MNFRAVSASPIAISRVIAAANRAWVVAAHELLDDDVLVGLLADGYDRRAMPRPLPIWFWTPSGFFRGYRLFAMAEKRLYLLHRKWSAELEDPSHW